MLVTGKVRKITIASGKSLDVDLTLHLDDEEAFQLARWREGGLLLDIRPAAEQLPLSDFSPNGTHAEANVLRVPILVDGQEWMASSAQLSGWLIKALAGVDPARSLFGWGHDADRDVDICKEIANEDTIPLEPWLRFVSTEPGGTPIVIDGVDHAVAEAQVTGLQLRDMAGVSAETGLFLIAVADEELNIAGGEEVPIGADDDDVVALEPGLRFITKIPAGVGAESGDAFAPLYGDGPAPEEA